MERELFRWIQRALRALSARHINGRYQYTDAAILAVYLWAVIHDRPVCWACESKNWSPGMAQHFGGVPTHANRDCASAHAPSRTQACWA